MSPDVHRRGEKEKRAESAAPTFVRRQEATSAWVPSQQKAEPWAVFCDLGQALFIISLTPESSPKYDELHTFTNVQIASFIPNSRRVL